MHTENLQYTLGSVAKVCQDVIFKCAGAIAYAFYRLSFDVTQDKAIVAVLALVVMDFITGITAAKMSGDFIKSSRAFRSAIKTFMYLLMISAAYFTEIAFPLASQFADETVIAFLAITELISIMENLGKMGYGIPIKMLNRLKKIKDNQ